MVEPRIRAVGRIVETAFPKIKESWWEKILCWFGKLKYRFNAPTVQGEIGASEVWAKIKAFSPSCVIYLADEKYKLATKTDIQIALMKDLTNMMQYQTCYLDCDDFSFRLMGAFNDKKWGAFAFGIGWSNVHAFNCFIDDKKQFYIVEPQTDEIILYEKTKDMYHPLQFVIM